MVDISSLSEQDICTQFITPALVKAGWDLASQVRQEVFLTAGRIIVRGKLASRGQRKRADYVLYHKPHHPLAVIEAKDANHGMGAGMQQALQYAEMLDVPFVFSSNGTGFLFQDRTGLASTLEQTLALHAFPSPEALWQRYCQWKGLKPAVESVIAQPYYDDPGGKGPRYFQQVAINQ